MTNEIFKNELLNDKQLDLVAGGNDAQTKVDIGFFMQLGYNMAKTGIRDAYGDNGINFVGHSSKDNGYYILTSGGDWTDGKYVQSFLKEHFHVQRQLRSI